jgi:crotonobetainyl-CoA:carnitine CoA-transferase CaiB-like acyl-CoA transferase
VETSLLEAALFWRDGVFAQYIASGRLLRRPGNGSAQIVPYGVFPTANRPIILGLAGDGLFAAFGELIGRGEQMRCTFVLEAAAVAGITRFALILVDCDDATRIRRLTSEWRRENLANPTMMSWAQCLRDEANQWRCTILDTTHLSLEDLRPTDLDAVQSLTQRLFWSPLGQEWPNTNRSLGSRRCTDGWPGSARFGHSRR